MRKITAIAWKDALIRFSSPSSLMQFLILPIIFTFLLAEFVYGGNEEAPIDLLVVDEDGSATAVALLDELRASDAIVVVEVVDVLPIVVKPRAWILLESDRGRPEVELVGPNNQGVG